jgi:hypothetical protein
MGGKEIEAQILDIDKSKVLRQLKSMGAEQKHPNTRFVRSTYHTCNGETRKVESFARVRKESGDVTITVKVYNDPKYPDEYEISTSNTFDETRALMLALNLKEKAVQETYREKWVIPAKPEIKEVTFDMIPGLPLYMEVEATSESVLNDFLDALGVDKSKMRTGAFSARYTEYYGISKTDIENNTPELTFADVHKHVKPVKNMKLFKDTIALQRKQLHITNSINSSKLKKSKTKKRK